MIPWSSLQAGLQALVAQLTTIPPTLVTWEATTDPFVPAGGAKADLMAFGVGSVGMLDNLSWSEQSPNGPLLQTATGFRELTLRTKVTVYDQRPTLVARNYLEMLRDRLAWDSTRDALQALSLGFQRALSLVDLSKPRDEHITSIAALDIRLNLSTSDTDPTQYSRITSGVIAGTYSQ